MITPMLGGGVEPMNHDPVTIIRPASIRGQLRFWWRACRAGAFDTVEDLREMEFSIWGGPSRAASVSLAVDLIDAYELESSNRAGWAILAYAGFPLQPDQVLVRGVQGTLRLGYPNSLTDEVSDALWAWGRFGGVGARTRRGFGAVQLDLPTSAKELRREVAERLQQVLTAEKRSWTGVPLLAGATFKLSPAFRTADEAWLSGVRKLQEFRQKRTGSSDRRSPGRSLWPEPDVIRVLTRRHAPEHAPRHQYKDDKAFPRAQFGLPIIFHFKDGGDPGDHTLRGVESDRLSSRLIIRPIEVQEGAVLIGVVLNSPAVPPGGVRLVPKDKAVSEGFEVRGDGVHIAGLTEADVLGTFLNSLRELRPAAGSPRDGRGATAGRDSRGRHVSKPSRPSETGSAGGPAGETRSVQATAAWHQGKVRLQGELFQMDLGINPAVFPPENWEGGATKATFRTDRPVIVEIVSGQVRSVKPAPVDENEEES